MFTNSIDSKANKLKLNVDNYLNEKRRQSQPPQQQSIASVRRPDQPSVYPSITPQTSMLNASTNGPPASQMPPLQPNGLNKPMELEIKILILQGKTYQKNAMTLKSVMKERSLNIFFLEEQTRYKLEMKILDNNFELKIFQEKSSVEVYCKKMTRYKYFKQENGEPKWMLMNEIKDEKLILVLNKESKNLKVFFDGNVPEELIKIEPNYENIIKGDDKSMPGDIADKEDIVELDSELINFIMPTTQQLTDTDKFRKSLKEMKEEEKNMILCDIFKIKKQYEDNLGLDRKKLKCPVFSCQKTHREISQLKVHLKTKHPELNKHGIEFTEFGTFEYSQKALDLALFLGKMYPGQMKKIIKKMKTKQLIE